MNETNTTTVETSNAINIQNGIVEIAECTTPFGVTLKGVRVDLSAHYSDDMFRSLGAFCKLVVDNLVPFGQQAINRFEKNADAHERRREREADTEIKEAEARTKKYEAEAALAAAQLEKISKDEKN